LSLHDLAELWLEAFLEWASVDLKEGKLRVIRSMQTVKGKGLVVSEPKSDKSRRQIVLPDFVLLLL
jgi:hypothetical protein